MGFTDKLPTVSRSYGRHSKGAAVERIGGTGSRVALLAGSCSSSGLCAPESTRVGWNAAWVYAFDLRRNGLHFIKPKVSAIPIKLHLRDRAPSVRRNSPARETSRRAH